MAAVPAPILLVGAGHMGGALIAGWRGAGVYEASDMLISDPAPGPAALAAARAGARLDPPVEALAEAKVVVLAVKPQAWRSVVAELAPRLGPGAAVISIMAGVESAAISEALGGAPVARVMPNTAAAIGQGAASVFCDDVDLLRLAHALFEPIATVVDLPDEALIHAATAVSGSAPAYLYALIEALAAAGVKVGLELDAAALLARTTLTGAAALLAQSSQSAAELRRQVTSPGGTTQAALEILMGPGGLADLLEKAVAAGVARSRSLG